jgi:hypothetical protein
MLAGTASRPTVSGKALAAGVVEWFRCRVLHDGTGWLSLVAYLAPVQLSCSRRLSALPLTSACSELVRPEGFQAENRKIMRQGMFAPPFYR